MGVICPKMYFISEFGQRITTVIMEVIMSLSAHVAMCLDMAGKYCQQSSSVALKEFSARHGVVD